MAEGGNYPEQAGHSQGRVTHCQSDSRNGPITEDNGYHAQPASTGIQCLDTDGDSSILYDERPIFTSYQRCLPNNVSCPPSLSPTTGIPLEHGQSASGFSDDRMNMPPDEHLQPLVSTDMADNGYHAQPASTGIQCLDTDGDSSILYDERPTFTSYQRCLPNNVSCPPSLSPTTGIPLEHCQSASGFSDDRMNMPPDEHLQPFVSTDMAVQAWLEGNRDNAHGMRAMEGLSLENTPRSAAVVLNCILAFVRDQDKVAGYRSTIQQLRNANISEDAILGVVIDNGVTCLTSRCKFFAKYDKDDDVSSVSSAQSSLSNMTSPSPESGSVFPTFGSRTGLRYPQYGNSNSRLQSYRNWQGVFQTKEQLCAAGLFYTGKQDMCRCFDCGVSIMKWKQGDIPIDEHKRLKPHCQFAQEVYIQTQANPDQSRRDTLENQHTICQVCCTNEIGVSQFKCGHIVCPKCVPAKPSDGAKRYCQIPMCHQEIQATSPYDKAALMSGVL